MDQLTDSEKATRYDAIVEATTKHLAEICKSDEHGYVSPLWVLVHEWRAKVLKVMGL